MGNLQFKMTLTEVSAHLEKEEIEEVEENEEVQEEDPEDESGDDENDDDDDDDDDDEEEEEEEEEMVDPFEEAREKCKTSKHCASYISELKACSDRVSSRSQTEETCVQEMFDMLHCVDHCAIDGLFKKTK